MYYNRTWIDLAFGWAVGGFIAAPFTIFGWINAFIGSVALIWVALDDELQAREHGPLP